MGIRIKSHEVKGDFMNKNKKLDKIENWGIVLQALAFILFIPYVFTDNIWILSIILFFVIVGFAMLLYVDLKRTPKVENKNYSQD
jgi:archaellum biogenesis protein FlaJ (TadC family)